MNENVACWLVQTTTDSAEKAERLAAQLVSGRLTACVQVIGPIQSHYRWEGRQESASEWLCVAKTTADAYDALERQIREAHDYDEPEILATPIVAGSRGYLQWVRNEIRAGGADA